MSEEFRVEKYATFLNNFELWIDAIVRQESMSEQQLVERVKQSYERSVQANIDHHNLMADKMQGEGEAKSAKHHRIMAGVYKALLE